MSQASLSDGTTAPQEGAPTGAVRVAPAPARPRDAAGFPWAPVSAFLGILWLGAVAFYMGANAGFERLRALAPHEIGWALAGAMAPAIGLWLLGLLFKRDGALARQTARTERMLDLLGTPDTDPRLGPAGHHLREQARLLAAAGEEAVTRLREAELAWRRQMADQAQAIEGAVEAAVRRAGGATDRLAERLTALGTDGEAVAARATELAEALMRQTAALDTAGATLARRMESFETGTRGVVALLESVAATVETHVTALDAAGRSAGREIGERADELTARQTAWTEAALGCATRLREAADGLRAEMATVEEASRAAANALGEAADGAGVRVRALKSDFQDAAHAADEAAEMIHVRQRSLGAAADATAEAAAAASKAIGERIDTLLAVVDTAEQRAQALDGGIRRSALGATAQIIETLDALAIDLTQALDEELPQELWTRYLKGEKHVFAHHLAADRERYAHDAIAGRMRDDEAFRNWVEAYVRQFETMLEEALAADRNDVLTTALLSSDVGKLFQVLSQATARNA
jgi:hypothetical protein